MRLNARSIAFIAFILATAMVPTLWAGTTSTTTTTKIPPLTTTIMQQANATTTIPPVTTTTSTTTTTLTTTILPAQINSSINQTLTALSSNGILPISVNEPITKLVTGGTNYVPINTIVSNVLPYQPSLAQLNNFTPLTPLQTTSLLSSFKPLIGNNVNTSVVLFNTTQTIAYGQLKSQKAGSRINYSFYSSNHILTNLQVNITKAPATYACLNISSPIFTQNICNAGNYHLPVAVIGGHFGLTNLTSIPLTIKLQSNLIQGNKVPFNASIKIGSNVIASFSNLVAGSINSIYTLNLKATDNFNFTFEGLGNENYSLDDPTITPPANVIAWLPVNVVTTAQPSNSFQQIFNIDAGAYKKYFSSNMVNTECFLPDGTLMTCWMLGSMSNLVPNSVMTGNLLTYAGNSIYYYALLPQNFYVGATNTFYFGFAGNNLANGANDLYDCKTTGMSPVLSPSYGACDNGAQEFPLLYSNALGTIPTAGFDSSGATQSNGVTLKNGNQPNHYSTSTPYYAGNVFNLIGHLDPSVPATASASAGFVANTAWRWLDAITVNGISDGSLSVGGGFDSPTSQIGTSFKSAGNYLLNIYALAGAANNAQYWINNAMISNGISRTGSGCSGGCSDNLGLNIGTGTPADLGPFYAFFLTTPPPSSASNTMPSFTVGGIQTAYTAPTVAITNPTNAIVDVGQTESFTMTITGGSSPFTENVYISNSLSPSIISVSNSIQSTTATTSNYILTVTQAMVSNSPLVANAVIVDANPTTANSPFSTAFTVNPALGQPTISPSSASSYSIGSTITISTYETGGSPAYTYNFLVFNSVTNILIANQLGPTNSFSFTANAAMASNTYKANVLITDAASTPTTANSINSGLINVTIPSSLTIKLNFQNGTANTYGINTASNVMSAGIFGFITTSNAPSNAYIFQYINGNKVYRNGTYLKGNALIANYSAQGTKITGSYCLPVGLWVFNINGTGPTYTAFSTSITINQTLNSAQCQVNVNPSGGGGGGIAGNPLIPNSILPAITGITNATENATISLIVPQNATNIVKTIYGASLSYGAPNAQPLAVAPIWPLPAIIAGGYYYRERKNHPEKAKYGIYAIVLIALGFGLSTL